MRKLCSQHSLIKLLDGVVVRPGDSPEQPVKPLTDLETWPPAWPVLRERRPAEVKPGRLGVHCPSPELPPTVSPQEKDLLPSLKGRREAFLTDQGEWKEHLRAATEAALGRGSERSIGGSSVLPFSWASASSLATQCAVPTVPTRDQLASPQLVRSLWPEP